MSSRSDHNPLWTSAVFIGLSTAAAAATALLVHPGLAALFALPASALGYRAGLSARQDTAPEVIAPSAPPAPERAVSTEPQLSTAPKLWVDEDAVLQRMGGSMAILQELTQLFAEENARRMVDLREALTRQDPQMVSREAHGIKSGLTNFCADDAVALAYHIEKTAREGSLEGLSEAINALDITLQEVTDQLRSMGRAA